MISPYAIVAPAQAADQVDQEVLLDAIRQVESGNRWNQVGSRGELGAYQFMALTWHAHTTRPFSDAKDPQKAEQVALEHLQWIRAGLRALGLPVDAYHIALVWNAGIGRIARHEVTATQRERARRCRDLYRSLLAPIYPPIKSR